MNASKLVVLTTALALTAACSKQKKATLLPPPEATAKVEKADGPAPAIAATDTLGVTEDLAARCTLTVSSATSAPKFEYNEDDLSAADRDVLTSVASCLTSGPLKGKKIKLVGRADPRGTTEYNLGLGTRRAKAVGTYLERLGVARAQLAINTRGALDASGDDEAGWQTDRRVDLELSN